MPDRRGVLRTVAAAAIFGFAGCSDGGGGSGGDTATSAGPTTVSPTDGFRLESPAFADGGTIPTEFTADGDDLSPPLAITGVPDAASTLTLVVDDPDAPRGGFTHWLLWNVPAGTARLPAGINQSRRVPDLGDARQGTNGFGELGYRGPRPPADDGPHTYRFTLYAVRGSLNVQAGARYPTLDRALAGSVVTSARLAGEYDR